MLNTHPDDLFKIPPSRNIASEKQFGVLAVVGNCGSPYRNWILNTLKDLIVWPNNTRAIDYYGSCGSRYDDRENHKGFLDKEDFDNGIFHVICPLKMYKLPKVLLISNSKLQGPKGL